MNFEKALELLKAGKKVRRKDWECSDTYLMFSNKELKLVDDEGEFQEIYYHLSEEDVLAVDWREYQERKEPLLTEEEKEYLRMIIKFSPGKVESVYLRRYVGGYSAIGFNDSADWGTYYVRREFFDKLECLESYTLEELGLDED